MKKDKRKTSWTSKKSAIEKFNMGQAPGQDADMLKYVGEKAQAVRR